jgi:hypothetical protein
VEENVNEIGFMYLDRLEARPSESAQLYGCDSSSSMIPTGELVGTVCGVLVE